MNEFVFKILFYQNVSLLSLMIKQKTHAIQRQTKITACESKHRIMLNSNKRSIFVRRRSTQTTKDIQMHNMIWCTTQFVAMSNNSTALSLNKKCDGIFFKKHSFQCVFLHQQMFVFQVEMNLCEWRLMHLLNTRTHAHTFEYTLSYHKLLLITVKNSSSNWKSFSFRLMNQRCNPFLHKFAFVHLNFRNK